MISCLHQLLCLPLPSVSLVLHHTRQERRVGEEELDVDLRVVEQELCEELEQSSRFSPTNIDSWVELQGQERTHLTNSANHNTTISSRSLVLQEPVSKLPALGSV